MTDLEARMRDFVKKRGLPLDVCLAPDPSSKRNAEIIDRTIAIYDEDPVQAWHSLIHETTEYRLKSLTAPYRRLINKLIEALEEEVYAHKEAVIDRVIRDHELWREAKDSLLPTDTNSAKKNNRS